LGSELEKTALFQVELINGVSEVEGGSLVAVGLEGESGGTLFIELRGGV